VSVSRAVAATELAALASSPALCVAAAAQVGGVMAQPPGPKGEVEWSTSGKIQRFCFAS
jgi:hypothetical protein